LVACCVTWPAILHPVDLVPGSERTDLWNSLWSLWFFQDRVWAGDLPFTMNLLDFPRESVFQIADPLNGFLAVLLVPVFGLSAAYTTIVIGHLVFSGVGAHLLARVLHRSERAGWIAGVGFACAPVLVSGIHNGTSETFAGGWLALAVLALLLAVDRPGWWTVVRAALALFCCCLGGWYAGVCAWLVWLGLMIVGRPKVSRGQSTKTLIAVAALGLGLCVPLAASMSQSVQEGNQIGIKSEREMDTVRRSTGSADPIGWVVPGDFRSPDFRKISRDNEEFVHSHYLGWTLILGAGLVFFRSKKGMGALALAGGLGFLLAMGPVLVHNGQAWVFSDGLAVPMPYFLVEGLPGFNSLSLLFRLGMLPALILAVFAAGIVHEFPRLWWAVVGIIFLELRFFSPVAGLPVVENASLTGATEVLALAPPGAVMNYPIVGGRPYLYEQTTHGKPIAGRLNFPNNSSSKKIWRALDQAQSMPLAEGRRHVRAVAQKTKTASCAELKNFCRHGELKPNGVSQSCRCVYGVRYLVDHEDSLARPDMHQLSVDWAVENLTVLAEDARMRVIQLW
jgi:hypothetical protein